MNEILESTEIKEDTKAAWQSIEQTVERTSYEVVSKKEKRKKGKGVRTRSQVIEEAVREKQKTVVSWQKISVTKKCSLGCH